MTKGNSNRASRKKMLIIFALFAATGGGLLLYGFIKTQAIEGDYWRQRSKERRIAELRDPAKRGDIYSSDGKVLATTIMVSDLYLDLGYRQCKDSDGVYIRDKKNNIVLDSSIRKAAFLEQIDTVCLLVHEGMPSLPIADIKRKITVERSKERPSQCFLVARNIPYTTWLQLCQVRGWGRGVIQQVDGRSVCHQMRVRIYDNLAGNVIGFRNGMIDKYTGLEGYYDSVLRGQDGIYNSRRLTKGVWLPTRSHDSLTVNESRQQSKIDGGDIVSTIDTRFQDIAENALRKALAERNALSGCAALMEVETGYVLACSNLTRDTNLHRYVEKINGNHACTSVNQPGSTFKPVVAAAMLSDDSLHLSPNIMLRSKSKRFDNSPQGELIDEHPAGDTISLADAIVYSSNVSMAELGWLCYHRDKSNHSRLVKQVKQVFPSDILNLDLSTNEYTQRFNSVKYVRDLIGLCFGYGTAVSPMQLLTFYNAIANDGRMMKPLFCREVASQQGSTKIKPVVLNKKAFSHSTAQFLDTTLQRVVTEGTASKSIKGTQYGIAGKTGTAKLNSQDMTSKNDAYFVGYFPVDKPKYSCIVYIHSTYGSGSSASAPVFKQIADGVMALDKEMGRQKMAELATRNDAQTQSPHVSKAYQPDMANIYKRMGMKYPMGDSSCRWVAYRDGYMPYAPKEGIMPDCKGMTIKDAMRLLDEMGIKVKFSGCGKVASQTPKAQTPIGRGHTAVLTLGH